MSKLSGGLNNYYLVEIKNPQRTEQAPYQAECEDIIQALGMTFDEGCAFKAIWRNAAARLGNGKPGNEALYDMQKLAHYANRLVKKEEVLNQIKQDTPEFFHDKPEVGNISEYSPDKDGFTTWVQGSKRPYAMQPYRDITVIYDTGITCNSNTTCDVEWNRVVKYRINYV